jgi:hypothetical protein
VVVAEEAAMVMVGLVEYWAKEGKGGQADEDLVEDLVVALAAQAMVAETYTCILEIHIQNRKEQQAYNRGRYHYRCKP